MQINITEKAVSEVKRILTEQDLTEDDEKVYLRLRILGGGCSGFQHKLDLTTDINDKIDSVFEVNGVNIVVDKRSALYVDGVTIDYYSDLNKRGFSVINPRSKSTCGCGSSFSM